MEETAKFRSAVADIKPFTWREGEWDLARGIPLSISAGVGFIAWNIDWVDRVEVRAGTVLPDSRTVDASVIMRVVEGDVNPRQQDTPLTLLDARVQPHVRVTVEQARDLVERGGAFG